MIVVKYDRVKQALLAMGESHNEKVALRDCGGVYNTKAKHWEVPFMGLRGLIAREPSISMCNETKRLYGTLKLHLEELEALKELTETPDTAHKFLMKHQAVCNRIAHLFKRFAFFLDTGKTLPLMLAIA